MVYKNLQCTFIFSFFHLLLWLTMCHCNGLDNHIRRSSFIHLQMDVTHEASEKTSWGHGQFSPILPAQASSPCQTPCWLNSQEGGNCLSDHHNSADVLYHSPGWCNDTQKATRAAAHRELSDNSWFHLGWRLKFHYVLYKLGSFKNNI